MLSRFCARSARLLALLALIAGLLGPAMPGFAAPLQPQIMQSATPDCSHHRQTPKHAGGTMDCCVANVCAMNLALPDSAAPMALPFAVATARYLLLAFLPPAGIKAAPIPHPPKAAA